MAGFSRECWQRHATGRNLRISATEKHSESNFSRRYGADLGGNTLISAKPGGSEHPDPRLCHARVHEEFLQACIGKNDTAYRAGWRSLVFSGQDSMPKSLDGDAAVVSFVANNAGAVGYIGKATPHDGVKVLLVK